MRAYLSPPCNEKVRSTFFRKTIRLKDLVIHFKIFMCLFDLIDDCVSTQLTLNH